MEIKLQNKKKINNKHITLNFVYNDAVFERKIK